MLTHTPHHPDGDGEDRAVNDTDARLRSHRSKRIPYYDTVDMKPGDVHVHLAHDGILTADNAKGKIGSNIIMASCNQTRADAERVSRAAGEANVYYATKQHPETKQYGQSGGDIGSDFVTKKATNREHHALITQTRDSHWRRLKPSGVEDYGSDNEIFSIRNKGRNIVFKKPMATNTGCAGGGCSVMSAFVTPTIKSITKPSADVVSSRKARKQKNQKRSGFKF